jgi:hypothetical protein
VRVRLLSGESVWLLLHIEVQASPEVGFEERIFIYSLRIFDRYRHDNSYRTHTSRSEAVHPENM